MSITLLTLTGDRPNQFALCEKYVARFKAEFDEWVVVDDGREPTKATMGQKVLRLPFGLPPAESFDRNLRTGLAVITSPNLAFIEDDDWYHPFYLDWCVEELKANTLVGEAPSIYFNISERLIRNMGNRGHASLCQTACRSDLARSAVRYNRGTAFDMVLWESTVPKHISETSQPFVVGMKGHRTGRAGIGVGHRPRGEKWKPDPELAQLERLVGADVENYR